jgi:hypothetical protein
MAMTRIERIALHLKQEKMKVKTGEPEVSELSEGVPELRSTEEGVVQYVKYNGAMYKNVLKPVGAGSEVQYGVEQSDTLTQYAGNAESGYQKFASGLMLQWGKVTGNGAVYFARAFATACFNIVLGKTQSDSPVGIPLVSAVTRTGFTYSSDTTPDTDCYWQAIGDVEKGSTPKDYS